MNTKTIIKLISIVAVCAIVFFGYRYFFGQSGDEMAGVTTVGADGQAVTGQGVTDYESQQFLSLLASVQDVGTKLREDFVNDPFFTQLKDYTVPVSPKPISRSNPFLPIGRGGPYVLNSNVEEENPVTATTTATSTTANTIVASSTTKKTPAPPAKNVPVPEEAAFEGSL